MFGWLVPAYMGVCKSKGATTGAGVATSFGWLFTFEATTDTELRGTSL